MKHEKRHVNTFLKSYTFGDVGSGKPSILSISDVVKSQLQDMELETNVLRDYAVAHQ